MAARKGRAFLLVLTIFFLSVAAHELYAADTTSLEPSRDSIIHIVTQIQRADYEGDRPDCARRRVTKGTASARKSLSLLESKVRSPHFIHSCDVVRLASDVDSTFSKHVGIVADRQREVHILFHQDNREPLFPQSTQG